MSAIAMAIGEAAGVAAAISVADKISPLQLDAEKLRNALAAIGAGPYTDA